jgi:hypothetical protein
MARTKQIAALESRIERRLDELDELQDELEELTLLEEDAKREKRAYRKASALRKYAPTLWVAKDPCETGATDVWDVGDSRIENGSDADPFAGENFCYSWQEIHDRFAALIEHIDAKEYDDAVATALEEMTRSEEAQP